MKQLASVILRAVLAREESWVDVNERYLLTLEQAVQLCTQEEAEQKIAVLLLTVCWNDAIMWAQMTMEVR
jgi:hypothetical protein